MGAFWTLVAFLLLLLGWFLQLAGAALAEDGNPLHDLWHEAKADIWHFLVYVRWVKP